jgi:hypothetical protein
MRIQKIFYIDEELNKRFRIQCAKKEVTMSQKISDLIEAYLKKEEGK